MIEPAPIRGGAQERAPLWLLTVDWLHGSVATKLGIGIETLWPDPIAVHWYPRTERPRLALPLQPTQITGVPTIRKLHQFVRSFIFLKIAIKHTLPSLPVENSTAR